MKTLATAIAIAVLATAASAETVYVRATVTDVQTMVDNIESTDCYPVRVPVRRDNTANVAAGAIIGGAIGNQFGSGDGKTAMTVLGAILGANSAQNNQRYSEEVVTQCETRYDQVVTGYLITYRWKNVESQLVSDYPYQIGDRIDATVTMY